MTPASPAVKGLCTLGFVWIHGRIPQTITTAANLPNLKQRWSRSIFKWYDHLTSIFAPSVGLEDVLWQVEALHKCAVKSLSDSRSRVSLLNIEVTQMHKAVLQKRMALALLTEAEGGTGAVIKRECCVYIPDYRRNVTGLIKDRNAQIEAL